MKRARDEPQWACHVCSLLNDQAADRCAVCETIRPAENATQEETTRPQWTCLACTLLNDGNVQRCAVCDTPATKKADEEWIPVQDGEDDYDKDLSSGFSSSNEDGNQEDDGPGAILSDVEKKALFTSLASDKTIESWWPKRDVTTFGVDYAKNTRGKCRHCMTYFEIGDLRGWIWSELGGGSIDTFKSLFHITCVPFPKDRRELMPISDIEKLSARDQNRVHAMLDYVYSPEVQNSRTESLRLQKKQKQDMELAASHRNQASVPLDQHILDFGKHKGLTFEVVARKEKSYCQWAIELPGHKCFGTMNDFRKYLRQQGYKSRASNGTDGRSKNNKKKI